MCRKKLGFGKAKSLQGRDYNLYTILVPVWKAASGKTECLKQMFTSAIVQSLLSPLETMLAVIMSSRSIF